MGFPLLAVIPVPGDELAVPTENRIRSHNRGELLEHLAAEDLSFDGEPPSLVIVEEYPFLPELLLENVILRKEVLNGILLPTIDPAGKDQE